MNPYDPKLTPRLHYYEQLRIDDFTKASRARQAAYEARRRAYREGHPIMDVVEGGTKCSF